MRHRIQIVVASVFAFLTIALIVLTGATSTLVESFKQIWGAPLATVMLMFVVIRLLQALALQRALQMQSSAISYRQGLELSALKGFYNLGISGAGLIAQYIYARSTRLFSLGQLAWATLLLAVLTISAMGALLAVSSILFLPDRQTSLLLGTLGLTIATAPLVVQHLVRREIIPLIHLPEMMLKHLSRAGELLGHLSVNDVATLWLTQAAFVAIRTGRVVFIVYALDPQAALGALATITLGADLVTAIPLTPGGIGVREFLIGVGGELANNLNIFLAAAIIDRGITIVGNLAHGLYVLAKQAITHRVSG